MIEERIRRQQRSENSGRLSLLGGGQILVRQKDDLVIVKSLTEDVPFRRRDILG